MAFGETHKQRRCNLALWGILHTWCYNLWLFKKKISKSVGKGLSKVWICGKYYEKLRMGVVQVPQCMHMSPDKARWQNESSLKRFRDFASNCSGGNILHTFSKKVQTSNCLSMDRNVLFYQIFWPIYTIFECFSRPQK